jgi:hypothetical protein
VSTMFCLVLSVVSCLLCLLFAVCCQLFHLFRLMWSGGVRAMPPIPRTRTPTRRVGPCFQCLLHS